MLPTGLRYATLATLAVGAIVSFGAVSNLRLALSAEALDITAAETPLLNGLTPNPEAYARAQRAQGAALRNTIEAMRWPRIGVLFVLAAASAMVFVSAMRLRWPAGTTRAGVTVLMARAALVTGIVRVLEGAQDLVIVQAAVTAYERVLIEQHVELPGGPSMKTLFSVGSVVTTLAVTALFLAASRYFQSARVQQTFALVDRNTPEQE